MTDASL